MTREEGPDHRAANLARIGATDTPGGGGRLVLLGTSPRVAPGLLSAQAWAALRTGQVLVRAPDHPQTPYLRAEDITVDVIEAPSAAHLAEQLVRRAQDETVVWLVSPDGDEDLGLALPAAVANAGRPPELEVVPGSYDLPGARLLDLVAMMDRLRSPGGCPWDARQTHESLVTYLVEETYETVEAIETGDLAHLREELGDLLLQVVFHARIAQEHADPWSIDDVAAAIVDKLVRRHPHVFRRPAGGDVTDPTDTDDVTTADELETTWEQLKSAEKGRTSATDGVPPGLPALSLAGKLISRALRAGVDVPIPADSSVGSRLLALAAQAQAAGLDPEAELRRAARAYAETIRQAETSVTGRRVDGVAE